MTKQNYKEIEERLEEVLDNQFPKGKCKERGQAIVLFAEAMNIIRSLFKSKKGWGKSYGY